MKKIFIKLIKLYQVSPLKSHSYCRFHPTCSNYMIESVNEYGLFKGFFKGFYRILRCSPFSKGGYDPVIKGEER